MKPQHRNLNAFIILSIIAAVLFSCSKEPHQSPIDDNPGDPTDSTAQYSTGWLGTDNPDSVPASLSTFGNGTLPSSYDLSPYLPPIGDQGLYGTCVAWSSAYYTKTATEAIAMNRTSAQLASTGYQMSPKDLFTAISDFEKKPGCDGTLFESALNVLQTRGVATLQTVPYTNLNVCSAGGVQPSWSADAGQHKILYYRTLANVDILTIKQQIANKILVMFGANLYENFYHFPANQVYSYFAGKFVGGHALTIVGYDDNKGTNGAFKIVNSWGANWCDKGFIWVDYQFFVNQFCSGRNV